MRQIVIDTETTGREVKDNHRVIEIGAVVIQDRWMIDEQFHTYLNPECAIDPGAFAIHGLSIEFLQNQPLFIDKAEAFLEFIQDAELIIHNAPFDVSFLNNELRLARNGYQQITHYCKITDTLQLARQLHPGQRNSLDALCKRYKINNSHRTHHGALLDAELLAHVYLQMTRGQPVLFDKIMSRMTSTFSSIDVKSLVLPIIVANPEELAAHQSQLESMLEIAGSCFWDS